MRKVAFLVLPEFSNLGLAAATEPLFVANWLAQRPVFDWQVVSVDGNPVRASNGRSTAVDGGLGAAADCQSVFVLASFEPQRTLHAPHAIRWLKRLARAGEEPPRPIHGEAEERLARIAIDRRQLQIGIGEVILAPGIGRGIGRRGRSGVGHEHPWEQERETPTNRGGGNVHGLQGEDEG